MSEKMRPASPEQAPDPAQNYERADPNREAGMGRLDNAGKNATPDQSPDQIVDAVTNKQKTDQQVNAQDDA